MPTMREIMAAKRAAQGGNAAPPKTEGRSVPVLSESSGTPAPDARTLEAERMLMEPHRLEAQAQARSQMADRLLCDTAADVPYVFRLPGDSPEAAAWKSALLLPANRLGIWMDTDGEHAWLAAEAPSQPELVLLHRLPLLNRRRESEPF